MRSDPTLSATLVAIVGPTATGKSDLAVDIAIEVERVSQSSRKVEIISADSVQIFRELKIGAARPPERDLARVKHHLVGHVSIADDYTAGDFERDAMALIESKPETDFLIVGGSGFYVQALLRGMYPIEKADPQLRAGLEARADQEGLGALHRELAMKDPESARKIAPQDRYRIVRALEAMATLSSGQTLTSVREAFDRRAQGRFGKRRLATIGLRSPKADLERRVRKRVQTMLQQGLLNEVEAVAAAGLLERPALQSVGYKQCLTYRQAPLAERSLARLEDEIVQATLKLAKKQRTWFTRDKETHWFDAETQRREAVATALALLT